MRHSILPLGTAAALVSLALVFAVERSPAAVDAAVDSTPPRGAMSPPSQNAESHEAAPPTEPLATDDLPPALVALRNKVRKTIAIYSPRHLNARDHTPWEVMHGFIAYGIPTQIYRDGPGGETVSAIGHLLWGGRCKGQPLVVLQGNRIEVLRGPGVQGHPGQFMAMLAQSGVSAKSPMRLSGRDFTVADLIEHEKRDLHKGMELTFKLIGLAHYLESDEVWTARDGQQWSIPKLVREEINSPIRGAACGGTHRLFAITYAYKMRQKRGEPVDGEYLRAQRYIAEYHRYTFGTLQNRDGSFSTEWFARPGDRPDLDRKLQTTGHILEWLAFSLPDEQLHDPRTCRAVDFLASMLLEHPQRSWSIGPLGHAMHALVMYDQRAFVSPNAPTQRLAQRTATTPVATSDVAAEPDADSRDAPSATAAGTGPLLLQP
jgi:hypothetical protein